MDEKLIALAEALDSARLTANSMEITAPQSGVYGTISYALQQTLAHIVGSSLADRVYAAMVENGQNVRDAIDHVERETAAEELIIQENAELEEIETELARKFSSSVYVVQPCNIPGTQLWEMQTYRGGKRTPEADFKVRAFKTSYGISTQSV